MDFSSRKIKLLTIILGIIVILSLNFYQGGVKGFFYSFLEDYQISLWKGGDNFSDLLEGILRAQNLERQNEDLRKYNQELLEENVSLKELKEENERLREALSLGLQKDFELVLADLVSKDVSRDSILINGGLGDGLKKGMPVITEQRVLLGKISEVYEGSSAVMLISDPESSFPAEIQEGEASGIIKGKGNYQISLEMVPRDQEIKEGDVIITTSLGEVFPKELLVGKVEGIQKSDIESFQKIKVCPFLNIEETKAVFVITGF